MRGFKFNFITVLAFCLLLLYAYFTAMGMLYRSGCAIWQAGLFLLAVVVVISSCIYLMCKARATRWEKIGIPGQIVLGLIIVGLFFYMGRPFSSYISVLGERQSVYESIDMVKAEAKAVNDAYIEYADQRISNYAQLLEQNAGAQIKVDMLNNIIKPRSITPLIEQRNAWLDEMNQLSISNVQMPANLRLIRTCVQNWTADFEKLSQIILQEEVNVNPFTNTSFVIALDTLESKLSGYSTWAFIVAVICSVFMLLPYFTTETWIGGRIHTKNNIEESEYI